MYKPRMSNTDRFQGTPNCREGSMFKDWGTGCPNGLFQAHLDSKYIGSEIINSVTKHEV